MSELNRGFYHRADLPGGLRVLIEPIPYVRSVAVGVWVAAGSRFEEPSQAGVTHLIEHLLFKGTERRSAQDIAEAIDAVGGQLNAFTSKEHTCYYCRVLDEHFELALDLLSDMLLRSRFDPEELDREKGVVLEEIKMYEDAPDELVHDLFTQTIWPDHPLGRNIVGTAPVLSALSRDDILSYFRAHYRGHSVVISIAGNVAVEPAVEAVGRHFADLWCHGDDPPAAPDGASRPPLAHPGKLQRGKDTEQVHICLGSQGVPQDHDDSYPLFVLNNCLGGGASSRLFQEIREKRGLAYSVYSYLSSYRDAGLFTVYLGTSPAQSERGIEIVLAEIERVRRHGLAPAELHRAKEQMKGQLVLSLESVSNRMSRLGRSEITLGRVLSPDEVIAKIDAVTLEDTVRVADAVLSGPLVAVAVGPAGKLPRLDRLPDRL